MNYVSLDIRLGIAVSRKVSRPRVLFHEKIIKLAFSLRRNLTRLGTPRMYPFDYDRIADTPGYIADIVIQAVRYAFEREGGEVDILLVDLSSSPNELIREPILIHLAEALDLIFSKRLCLKVIVLLPELPGLLNASIQRLNTSSLNNQDSITLLLALNGAYHALPESFVLAQSFKLAFGKAVNEKQEEPASRFENKIVRRLGHFSRARHPDKCRQFSYLTDNADDELVELINQWWSNQAACCEAILYDTANNPSLTTAIKTFCGYQQLAFYRIHDVLDDATVAEKAKLKQSCLIILDVVETGGTLLEHAAGLNHLGISVHKEVLTAISKAGKETTVGPYRVSSFAVREPEAPSEHCLQCRLSLPFTSDEEEEFNRLRAFDMWYMAEQVGWEGETEVPDNIGRGYEAVPKFTRMLNEYGDWIAYKMEKLYSQRHRPDNIFILHPDEPGARSVSDGLRIRFNNQLSIVKVPRSAIKLAQEYNNSWEKVFTKIGKAEWVSQLESLSQASAIITDIFNASGSTYQSLFQLLRYLNVSIFCYFPFVDRDCGPGSADRYSVLKLSLYQWYGPRQVKRRAETRDSPRR